MLNKLREYLLKRKIEKSHPDRIPNLIRNAIKKNDQLDVNKIATTALRKCSRNNIHLAVYEMKKSKNRLHINEISELAINECSEETQHLLMEEFVKSEQFNVNKVKDLAIDNTDPKYLPSLMKQMIKAKGIKGKKLKINSIAQKIFFKTPSELKPELLRYMCKPKNDFSLSPFARIFLDNCNKEDKPSLLEVMAESGQKFNINELSHPVIKEIDPKKQLYFIKGLMKSQYFDTNAAAPNAFFNCDGEDVLKLAKQMQKGRNFVLANVSGIARHVCADKDLNELNQMIKESEDLERAKANVVRHGSKKISSRNKAPGLE